jgi:glucosylceramidase
MFLCIFLIINIQLLYAQQVEVWLSDPMQSKWLNKESSLNFQSSTSTSPQFVVNVNESIKYQTMDGFGASLTDASCWLFKNKLSTSKRDELLRALFGQDGIGLSILRQPIGASDFSWEAWTYADSLYDDWALSSFAFWREDDYIFPILSQALSIQPGRIKLFGSPWSPPAWMRKDNHLFGTKGGYLRPECYDVYADYFVKYVQGYAAKGLLVYAVSLQNEPLYAPEHYQGMIMSIQDQIGFIRDYLGPKFTLGGIRTKIIAYDHNYDQAGLDYSRAILNNPGSNRYCSGIGFHTYTWPQHDKMNILHNEFPNKDIWITEAGSGTWIGSDVAQFSDQMMHLIRSPRNWAKGVVFWNVALDQNSSPKLANVDSSNSNRGLVTIRSDMQDQWQYELGYYSMGHSSKFVNPNAERIFSDTFQDKVETVAYLNQDQSIVLIISNREANLKKIQVKWSQKVLEYSMPANSALTLKWHI